MVLWVQISAVALLALAVLLWALHFPYPSPLIRPLLPGRKRWPEKQVRGWLARDQIPPRFFAYFTRDPERRIPGGRDFLAPADGLVTSADTRDGIRYLVIALSFWDVHVQRSPLSGRVVAVEALGDIHADGEGRDFAFLREKHCPVQTRISMDTDIGRIAIRLITSLAARRIETWVDVGDELQRGQRIGRILLGSTVVLELPEHYLISVTDRQRVRAGETILARVGDTTS